MPVRSRLNLSCGTECYECVPCQRRGSWGWQMTGLCPQVATWVFLIIIALISPKDDKMKPTVICLRKSKGRKHDKYNRDKKYRQNTPTPPPRWSSSLFVYFPVPGREGSIEFIKKLPMPQSLWHADMTHRSLFHKGRDAPLVLLWHGC